MEKHAAPLAHPIENEHDFQAVYDLYITSIYRFLYWRTSDEQLAQDLTSNVFTKAWQARKRFTGGSVKAWLYSIARHNLIDYWRSKKEIPTDKMDTYTEDDDMATRLDTRMEADRLRAIIRDLPVQMRQVIELRFLRQLTTAETARQLSLSEGNVRIIQYRALRKIRSTFNA